MSRTKGYPPPRRRNMPHTICPQASAGDQHDGGDLIPLHVSLSSGFILFSSTCLFSSTRLKAPQFLSNKCSTDQGKKEKRSNRQRVAMAAEGKSKVLVIGGTGYIGKFIVAASAKLGHPTFLLIRKSTAESTDPGKAKTIQGFRDAGVTFLYGDLFDHESLVAAFKQVDVVISTVGGGQLSEQTRIVAAIKEAGNIKRFFPSEFGNDVDRVNAVEPAKSVFEVKASIRRLVESEGIPYTIVCGICFAGYFLPNLAQPDFLPSPPRDKAVILGDGNPKAIFVHEEDIAAYTIKAVDDPRTLNKIVYPRPPENILSFNELVALWESKIGKTLEKVYVSEEQVLQQIQGSPFPVNVVIAISHSVFVKGDQTNFEIEPSFGVNATELYPDVKYTTVSQILDRFV